MMKLKYIMLMLFITALFCGCGENEEKEPAVREIFAMDTVMSITAYGENCEAAADAAVDEINRLDRLLSVGNEKSEVSEINKNGRGVLSEDCRILTEKALDIYRTAEGAYDMTVYPLMKLWGFIGDEPSLPDDKDIKDVCRLIGSDKLSYDGNTLTLGEGQGIDFGGIAKGYASARIMDIFKKYDIDSGIVSLGGNVQCYGKKPDGSLWKCGITDPAKPGDSQSLLGIVQGQDIAVITSGGYERYFKDENGKTYHHIMDTKTGYPAESDLSSVTVVSGNGMLADGLSTACFVMGREKAIEYWKKYSSDFDLILYTNDNRLYITEGLRESFSSEYEYEIAERE